MANYDHLLAGDTSGQPSILNNIVGLRTSNRGSVNLQNPTESTVHVGLRTSSRRNKFIDMGSTFYIQQTTVWHQMIGWLPCGDTVTWTVFKDPDLTATYLPANIPNTCSSGFVTPSDLSDIRILQTWNLSDNI